MVPFLQLLCTAVLYHLQGLGGSNLATSSKVGQDIAFSLFTPSLNLVMLSDGGYADCFVCGPTVSRSEPQTTDHRDRAQPWVTCHIVNNVGRRKRMAQYGLRLKRMDFISRRLALLACSQYSKFFACHINRAASLLAHRPSFLPHADARFARRLTALCGSCQKPTGLACLACDASRAMSPFSLPHLVDPHYRKLPKLPTYPAA